MERLGRTMVTRSNSSSKAPATCPAWHERGCTAAVCPVVRRGEQNSHHFKSNYPSSAAKNGGRNWIAASRIELLRADDGWSWTASASSPPSVALDSIVFDLIRLNCECENRLSSAQSLGRAYAKLAAYRLNKWRRAGIMTTAARNWAAAGARRHSARSNAPKPTGRWPGRWSNSVVVVVNGLAGHNDNRFRASMHIQSPDRHLTC